MWSARVHVEQSIYNYIVELVRRTRQHDDTYLGASPRGSLGLLRASQASAILRGRDYVIPDDVKALVSPVLGHRIILAPGAHLRDLDEIESHTGIVRSSGCAGRIVRFEVTGNFVDYILLATPNQQRGR